MMIPVTCPHCGVTGRLREEARGHRILCPRCGMRFDLPGGSGPPSAAPGAEVDPFGNPAQSGFYESPTVDADAGPSAGGPAVPRRTIIAIKGTKEWGEWLASASKASGMPAAVLVEVALAEWAARHGYTAPPGR